MGYESKNPQTNISVFQYYQQLAYKYRNWLLEFNKYKEELGYEIIPTIKDKNAEDVPQHLLPNASIKFVKIIREI